MFPFFSPGRWVCEISLRTTNLILEIHTSKSYLTNEETAPGCPFVIE